MFTFNAQNAVVVRDTVDKVALVEKLLHDMDKPKAEVVIDIMVMEVNSDRARTIGAGLASAGGTTGLSIPFGFTPRNPVTPCSSSSSSSCSEATTLNNLGHLSSADFSTTLPGATLQAFMSDSMTRVMQSPEVRASDGQKVSLKIGDRVPYATGSFQPGASSVGVSPLVSTQFQFVDTGVNVEITPHVHGTSEVTLHVGVDISQVSSYVSLGGLSQPVISQRKSEAEIRLQDGAVSLLGGLMQSQDIQNINGIPGLVNMPVLGKYLFGTNSKDKSRQELVIALIPHIVRAQDLQRVDLRRIATGTEQAVKLSYGARPEETPITPGGTMPPAGTSAAPQTPISITPAVPGERIRLSFVPPAVETHVSAQVVVGLQVDNAIDLAAVPIRVRWDPKILRLNQMTPAGLMAAPGGNPPSLDIRNDAGDAGIEISRPAGVNGSGMLMQFTFTAVGKGTSNLTVTELGLRDSQKKSIPATAPSLPVTVQ
jgi:general secretion pathway protein D